MPERAISASVVVRAKLRMTAERPPTMFPLPGRTQEYSTPISTESRNAVSSICTESSASARNSMRVHVLVGLALVPGLAGALHADVAVRVDESRGDHGELADEVAASFGGDPLDGVPLEEDVGVLHDLFARVQRLSENRFHVAEYSESRIFDQGMTVGYNGVHGRCQH